MTRNRCSRYRQGQELTTVRGGERVSNPDTSTRSDPASSPPLAGHGSSAHLRLRPACIVDGQIQGGNPKVYELVCPDCGDDPGLDYFEVPPRLQWLRGPRTLEGGLAAYGRHLGIPWPMRAEPDA